MLNIVIQPRSLLHLRGILRQAYKSGSGTGYLTADPAQVLKALQVLEEDRVQAEPEDALEGVPGDLQWGRKP